MAEQSYQNHRQYVPGFHFVTFGILALNVLWSLWRLFQGAGLPLPDRIWNVVLAIGLVLLAWYSRTFPMRVQDRVIRAEERLRLAQLLPPDLASRVGELRPGQLVALRFASDEEVPDLTRKVLAGELRGGDDIKKAIQRWRADYLRA